MAYGDAGWNEHSSSIGNFSLGTLPNTSLDAQICILASLKLECFKASNRLVVPIMFVCNVSTGATKLVCG